jgi:hypothetical protein
MQKSKNSKLEIINLSSTKPSSTKCSQRKMKIGFSGALNLSVTLTVGLSRWLRRKRDAKVKKLEIGDNQPQLNKAKLNKMQSKEDENRVFRCAGFNGDAYSRPGLVVREELMSKIQKLEIGDNQPQLNKAKLNKMKSKED